MAQAEEDTKLFDQCRVCIVCTSDLPLESAEQVCMTPITANPKTHQASELSDRSPDRGIWRRAIDPPYKPDGKRRQRLYTRCFKHYQLRSL